jgi:hypothetical protein
MSTQLLDGPSLYEPLSLKIVSGAVGDVYSLPLCGVYYYIFLPKLNGSVSSVKSFLGLFVGKKHFHRPTPMKVGTQLL